MPGARGAHSVTRPAKVWCVALVVLFFVLNARVRADECSVSTEVMQATAPSASAAPLPHKGSSERLGTQYVRFEYLLRTTVYNELSPGNTAAPSLYYPLSRSFSVDAGFGFTFAGRSWIAQARYDRLAYEHDANYDRSPPGFCPDAADEGCVTLIGSQVSRQATGSGQGYAESIEAIEDDAEFHLATQISRHRFYAGLGYLTRQHNYFGYPSLSAVGVGVEKYIDLQRTVSAHGGLWIYPDLHGRYVAVLPGQAAEGTAVDLRYTLVKYDLGISYKFARTPLFLDAGFRGAQLAGGVNAPSSGVMAAEFVGIGMSLSGKAPSSAGIPAPLCDERIRPKERNHG
jgi:hypothetical protein